VEVRRAGVLNLKSQRYKVVAEQSTGDRGRFGPQRAENLGEPAVEGAFGEREPLPAEVEGAQCAELGGGVGDQYLATPLGRIGARRGRR
jgi:hypothetical protein